MAEVTIEDAIRVDAHAREVWRAIEDPAVHAAWHPYVVRITGAHRLGASRSCAVLVGRKTGETRERASKPTPHEGSPGRSTTIRPASAAW